MIKTIITDKINIAGIEKKKDVEINIKLGLGKAKFNVLTSDFSEDYVLINSDYRS